MKLIFIFLGTAHALVHLIGFLKGTRLKDFPNIKSHISGVASLGWMLSLMLLFAACYLLLSEKTYWWKFGIAGALCSQIMILTVWKDASKGTLVNLIFLFGCFIGRGNTLHEQELVLNQKSLYGNIRIPGAEIPDTAILRKMPVSVRTWLLGSGIFTKEKPVSCRVYEKGRFCIYPQSRNLLKGYSFGYYRLDKIAMAGNAVMTQMGVIPHTSFWRSMQEGNCQTQLMYLFDQGFTEWPQKTQQFLEKYLLEIPLFPSAALNPEITWKEQDDQHVIAQLQKGQVKIEVLLTFQKNGEWKRSTILLPETDGRYHDGTKLEAIDFTTLNGLRVPEKIRRYRDVNGEKIIISETEIMQLDYNHPHPF